MPAFIPSAPLLPQRVGRRYTAPICGARPPQRTRPSIPLRLLGAVASVMTMLFTPGASVEAKVKKAPTPTKELRYDGRQELDSGEKAMSLTLTAGSFAALAVWAWKQNRRDDELETIRIREEVERLEKLKAEFVDVDEEDESMDDEDLLASLKQRIGGEEEGGDGEGKGEGEEDEEGKGDEDEDGEVGQDSVDMLKRMWDATDDDTKKGAGKS